jgi:adhesin transport system outer membrane protein
MMGMRKTVFAGCLTGMALVLASVTAQAEPMSAELQGLLDSNPQISSARKTASGTEEGISQAFGSFLPQVTVSGDAGYEYVDNPSRRSSFDDSYSTGRDTATVNATQLLYDGGATSAAYNAAKGQHNVATSDMASTEQNVLYQGVAAYLNVLRQRELIALSRQNEDNIKRQLNLESERVSRGSGIAVDVLQAKSRLQISKERRVTVEGAFKDALATYEQVFGHAPATGSMNLPTAPLHLLPKTLDEAVKIALSDNPALASARAQSDIANEQRDAAHAGYLPTIALEAESNYEHNKNTVRGVRRDVTVLVTANWSVFDGFATRAGVAKAAYDYAASQDNEAYIRRRIEEQTKIAWQALETARQRVSLLQNAVNIASEVYTSRVRLREAGKETAINVLDAENEVFNARINLTSAVYDANLATYQVLLAMGQLDLSNATASGTEKIAQAVE